ncbi:MAG: M20/M25/M40 family metallo-hydrolase [Thermomicrobiales bacterium]
MTSTTNAHKINRRALVLAPSLAILARGLVNVDGGVAATTTAPDWLPTIEDLVRIETWRAIDGSNEAQVVENIGKIKTRLAEEIDAFVSSNGLAAAVPSPFEWKDTDKPYWVFGWRVGTGANKVAVICHLDTVPPGDADWSPFEPRIEQREYEGTTTDFLIGRGAIDDKGPAVAALHALLSVLPDLEKQPDLLQNVTLEVLFDTSEETDMSTPYYLAANPDAALSFGIVFDGMWTVRAEKGIERPIFSVPFTSDPTSGLRLESLGTSAGPANQIADSAEARIIGSDSEALDAYAGSVATAYGAYGFDDPGYHAAVLEVTRDGTDIVLTTRVAGAQHGSAPEENRADGANPLVSLANFIAGQAAEGTIEENHYTRMSDFIAWGWGTMVFGEKHPGLLLRYDEVFEEGNGTTYALTRVLTDQAAQTVTLAIDIRYATGHHETSWDGTDGMIPGKSLFGEIFDELVKQYAATERGSAVAVTTTTADAPDIRNPDNEYFKKVNAAYREAMGVDTPMLAIGGGTDAKGHPELVAAGSLFTTKLGDPINFHGINEGAPIVDLVNSQKILISLLRGEAGLD